MIPRSVSIALERRDEQQSSLQLSSVEVANGNTTVGVSPDLSTQNNGARGTLQRIFLSSAPIPAGTSKTFIVKGASIEPGATFRVVAVAAEAIGVMSQVEVSINTTLLGDDLIVTPLRVTTMTDLGGGSVPARQSATPIAKHMFSGTSPTYTSRLSALIYSFDSSMTGTEFKDCTVSNATGAQYSDLFVGRAGAEIVVPLIPGGVALGPTTDNAITLRCTTPYSIGTLTTFSAPLVGYGFIHYGVAEKLIRFPTPLPKQTFFVF